MIIRLYKKNYRLKQNTAASAKKMVKEIFNQVRIAADVKGVPEFYTAFIIMVYITSASILQELGPEKIRKILEEIQHSKH